MGRSKLIRTSRYPYHIVSRSNHKFWFSIPLEEVWEIVEVSLISANKKYPIKLHAFVLMSNHYHLLATTPNKNIDKFMYEFNKKFSEKLRIRTNMVNRMFGGRYKWTVVDDSSYYLNVLKYLYRNPVKAKMTRACELYPYCSLWYLMNNVEFVMPIKVMGILEHDQQFIDWINSHPSEEDDQNIKIGLAKTQFKLGRDPISKRKRLISDCFIQKGMVENG